MKHPSLELCLNHILKHDLNLLSLGLPFLWQYDVCEYAEFKSHEGYLPIKFWAYKTVLFPSKMLPQRWFNIPSEVCMEKAQSSPTFDLVHAANFSIMNAAKKCYRNLILKQSSKCLTADHHFLQKSTHFVYQRCPLSYCWSHLFKIKTVVMPSGIHGWIRLW